MDVLGRKEVRQTPVPHTSIWFGAPCIGTVIVGTIVADSSFYVICDVIVLGHGPLHFVL